MRTNNARTVSVVLLLILAVSWANSQMRTGKLGLGLGGTTYFLQSDYKTSDLSAGGAVNLTYSVAENIGLRSSLGFGYFQGKDALGTSLETSASHWNLTASYDFMPHDQFSPFLSAGAGLLFFDPRTKTGNALTGGGSARFDINFLGGAGFDYFFDEFWALTVSAEGALGFTDQLDGIKGGGNDGYVRFTVGIRYHFFDEDFVRRMIDAFGRRGK